MGALLLYVALARAADTIALDPAFLRVDLKPQDVIEVEFTVRAAPGTLIQNVAVDCACLHLLTPVPAAVPAANGLPLRFRVTGMRPGVEEILVGTSIGIVRSQLQIVGPGAGRGRDELAHALKRALQERWRVLAICHDLRGQVRHCGCSLGALGGAGRLARLPGLAQELQPTVPVTWVLTGDIDGKRAGVGAALSERGWTKGDPTVRVSDEPLSLLTMTGIVVVIPTVPVAVNHRRLLRPLLASGLAVELLLVDPTGAVQARHTMPVDDSLPDDLTLAERFRDPLTSTIQSDLNPSTACATCHPTSFAAWKTTKHARALADLPEVDRTDSCITCHTLPVAKGVVAPNVNCQSCHQGTALHIDSKGKLRTTGAVDCRTCHDATHNPTFQRERNWPLIQHGREVVPVVKP